MIFKQFGVGLAAAILIDATIVRAILLPASMKLLGDWNWYLPKWLEWLPHFDHGGPSQRARADRTRAGAPGARAHRLDGAHLGAVRPPAGGAVPQTRTTKGAAMKVHLNRTSRRSRLENRSTSHKVLIVTSMLAVTGAVLLGAGAGAGGAAPTRANATPSLGQSLSQLVAAGAPGATLLVRQGDRTTVLARGFADVAAKKRMRPGDSFRIGSLTKTYVATLLLQLAEEGRLALDDAVA